MEDQHYLVCVPVAEKGDTIAGSIAVMASCGHSVWIAPSSHRLVDEHSALIVCTRCADAQIAAAAQPVEIRSPSREQLDEIARHQEHNL